LAVLHALLRAVLHPRCIGRMFAWRHPRHMWPELGSVGAVRAVQRGQSGWRFCVRRHQLYFAVGGCTGGGNHDEYGRWVFVLLVNPVSQGDQSDWRLVRQQPPPVLQRVFQRTVRTLRRPRAHRLAGKQRECRRRIQFRRSHVRGCRRRRPLGVEAQTGRRSTTRQL